MDSWDVLREANVFHFLQTSIVCDRVRSCLQRTIAIQCKRGQRQAAMSVHISPHEHLLDWIYTHRQRGVSAETILQ